MVVVLTNHHSAWQALFRLPGSGAEIPRTQE
ncbi:hypothetical protein EYZ11_011890 [Aspergillus tanneri]|uniref:Uncharacterized protein n=1 Tax=Aspergillus tanneri TaxID=1220188 RepID=A0A4V3UMU7_9EURO|nr:hypothetical protein EYZ11_011890 [Aspergillus tanneri]